MIRITLPYVWDIAEQLEHINRLKVEEQPRVDLAMEIYGAQTSLETLLRSSVFAPYLRSCRQLGGQLLEQIRRHTVREEYNGNADIGEMWQLKNAFSQFKIAFLAELGTLPSYFVSQKGSHDTLTLLDQPGLMFPSDLSGKVPEAMFDVGEAGKALCYELPTACGFHLFRAIESVLRRYYGQVAGGVAAPKVRTIGTYVRAMRQQRCGEDRILSVLEQIGRLHRNPVIHPEVALSVDEAISLIGMSHSAITSMLMVLPFVPATTGMPSTGGP